MVIFAEVLVQVIFNVNKMQVYISLEEPIGGDDGCRKSGDMNL